uniref:hypothetical protein 54 n=1 Tax=Moniliophthora perniciosa TaxID=153609 RepID=UPI0000242367|nr:hypothetical protein 54 [Moniliophthora perniciosa]AAQ74346.1 hypothetical protein 54 [Moniliophthora perniciosa]
MQEVPLPQVACKEEQPLLSLRFPASCSARKEGAGRRKKQLPACPALCCAAKERGSCLLRMLPLLLLFCCTLHASSASSAVRIRQEQGKGRSREQKR